MKFGQIRQDKVSSPIELMRQVRPSKSGRSMIRTAAPLMLTSLVDAFAVIVIYLLASTQQQGTELKVDKKISLPTAKHSQSLEKGINMRVVGSKYFIEDTELAEGQVADFLVSLNKTLKADGDQRQGHLIIQADKNSDFRQLSPVLVIAAQTGFENVRFAVMGE